MKFQWRGLWSRPVARWSGLSAIALGVALAISCAWIRLWEDMPRFAIWKAAVACLMAVEAGYPVTAVAACTGVAILGRAVWNARRRRATRPAAARGLLLCFSILCSLVVAEVCSAVWLNRLRQTGALAAADGDDRARGSRSVRLAPFAGDVEPPADFAGAPADGDVDLVVLGGSSAQGVPFHQWVSIGHLVAWKLEESIPGRSVRLQVVARSGDTLERQHQVLAGLERRPDVLIVYAGHNEFQLRFFAWRDPEYYRVDRQPSWLERLLDRFEKLSPLCALIKRVADQCRVGIPPPPERQRELVDVPVYTPAEYRVLLDDFGRRLESIVGFAEKVGAIPVLILPPGNDAGFEPNRSFLAATTPPDEREAFQRDFLAVRRRESVDRAASIEQYRRLVARQPCFAEAHFRLARLLEQEGDWAGAYRHYVSARDFDGYPMRCHSEFQQVYREVAARHRCILIDGQSYFHTIGRHGLLDDELFQDAMHPSLRGQIALAQAVLAALRARRALGWPAGSPAPVIDPAGCTRRFGIGMPQWRAICAWRAGFNGLVDRLRYENSERRSRIADAGKAAIKLDAGVAPEAVGLPNLGVPQPVPFTTVESGVPAG